MSNPERTTRDLVSPEGVHTSEKIDLALGSPEGTGTIVSVEKGISDPGIVPGVTVNLELSDVKVVKKEKGKTDGTQW